MKTRWILLTLALSTFAFQNATAQPPEQIVRLAKLVIDSAYLEPYKVLLKEGIETALRTEPGVITLYAVFEKERPTHFTILETYANADAYRFHIQTPHFLKYKNGTLHMVKSLQLIDTVPLVPESPLRQK